jgi:D-beta-D-heptose 7-phosphate kinase/D-beta-D-heptose 1-phosphate adenosyltransferase
MSKSIVVSGGFDPIHIGHVRMILEASQEGDVIVIANSDEWLQRKKGYVFMPWEERAEIIRSIRGVADVVRVNDMDNSVCEAIKRLHNSGRCDMFANGGDRKNTNTPEVKLCEELRIKMLWNVGGGKIQSSSDLVSSAQEEPIVPPVRREARGSENREQGV